MGTSSTRNRGAVGAANGDGPGNQCELVQSIVLVPSKLTVVFLPPFPLPVASPPLKFFLLLLLAVLLLLLPLLSAESSPSKMNPQHILVLSVPFSSINLSLPVPAVLLHDTA